MRRKSNEMALLRQELDLIKFYRQNPVIAAKDILRVELAVPQQVILESMWFKNFTLVTAGRGCGKCVTYDTLVPTDKGFVEIGSLGEKLSPLSSLEVVIEGIDGPEPTSHWYYDGCQKTYKVTTSRGYTIEGTPDHKLIVFNSAGEFIWKKLEDVNFGDVVALNRSNEVWASEDSCTADQAKLLGLLIGDGCFSGSDSHLGFTNGNKEVVDAYSSLMRSVFSYEPTVKWSAKNNCWEVKAYGKNLWSQLESLGVTNGQLSGDKAVPRSVLRSGKEVISSFLSGLFEADGGVDGARVSYTTKSKKLAQQVHLLLLSLGIPSSKRVKKVSYGEELRDYWSISFGSESLELFYNDIGFISSTKSKSLLNILNRKRNPNLDVIPNLSSIFKGMWKKTRGVLAHKERDKLKRYKYGKENPSYSSLLREIKRYPFNDEFKAKLEEVYEKNYFFDTVREKEEGFGDVYDFVVPGTHSFTGNGFVNHNTFLNSVFSCLWALLYPGQKVGLLAPSFRQAKMLFSEVEKRWNQSPLLQEATRNKPITASDRCYLSFRQSGFKQASVIEAVPLGDGSKIRGARYYAIVADEFAQIPETIFNTVILPMGATVADPMENVKKLARQRELINKGLATAADFKEATDNKVIMTSSAFFQFNHMYQTKLGYEEAIRRGEDKFSTHTISFRDMPEGFLSEENIKNAKSKLSDIEFRMEYEAIWEADSAGVFKASLVEKCRKAAEHSVACKGRPGAEYILGVDPARASDAFALCLLEVGYPYKVVAAWEYYQNVFPKMAQTIMDICNNFNVVAIHMDAGAGGGGLAMKDLLAEEERWGAAMRIIDADDEENKDLTGRHILHMFNPSPKSNAEAVYSTLNLMEKGGLVLPQRPKPRGTSREAFAAFDAEEVIYETVENMLRQIMMIEVSESRSGVAHFDVPRGGGHASQKKDLYTAYILACRKAYELALFEEEEGGMLEIGIIENRPDYVHVPKNILTENLEVTQAPVKSWPFRKTFKPGS